MRPPIVIIVFALCAACGSTKSTTSSPPTWLTDLDAGLAEARRQHARGVMVDVAAEWNLPSKELARAYETPVMRRALDHWIRVRIDVTNDSDANQAFLDRWRAGTPTILFLDPDGRELSRITRALPADELAARVPH